MGLLWIIDARYMYKYCHTETERLGHELGLDTIIRTHAMLPPFCYCVKTSRPLVMFGSDEVAESRQVVDPVRYKKLIREPSHRPLLFNSQLMH